MRIWKMEVPKVECLIFQKGKITYQLLHFSNPERSREQLGALQLQKLQLSKTDVCVFIKRIFEKILGKKLPSILFEAAHSTKILKDRRLRVDIVSVRQAIHNNEIIMNWLKTQQQLANVLTKQGASSTVMNVLQKQSSFMTMNYG